MFNFFYSIFLFVLLTPSLFFTLFPKKSNKYLVAFTHAALFTLLWHLTYKYTEGIAGVPEKKPHKKGTAVVTAPPGWFTTTRQNNLDFLAKTHSNLLFSNVEKLGSTPSLVVTDVMNKDDTPIPNPTASSPFLLTDANMVYDFTGNKKQCFPRIADFSLWNFLATNGYNKQVNTERYNNYCTLINT
jgi:hypothetical protein